VLTGDERRPLQVARLDELRQRRHPRVVVDVEEQWEGPALLADLAHPVARGDEAAARPGLEDVADVDDERIFERRNVDPRAGRVQHLEAGCGGLEQREALIVGVRPDADGVGGIGVVGVVQQPQLARRLRDSRIEQLRFLPQRQREAAQQPAPERHAGVVPGGDGGLKAGQVRPLVGAEKGRAGEDVGVVGRQLEPAVVRLLAVARAAGEDLLALRHIAAVAARAADVDPHLLLERQGEEALRHLEQVGEQLRVDAGARDVEKADLASCAAQLVGYLVLGVRRIRGQPGHVDDGHLGERRQTACFRFLCGHGTPPGSGWARAQARPPGLLSRRGARPWPRVRLLDQPVRVDGGTLGAPLPGRPGRW